MGRNKSTQRQVCEDYCKEYKNIKNLTLAKKIKLENPELFAKYTIESIRKSFVNIIRGTNGVKSREKVSDKSLFKPLTHDTRNSPKIKDESNIQAKVLILDIETAPIKAYVWGIWNQNISTNQIQSDWFCITWAAKWLFEDKVYSGCLTPAEIKKEDDKRMIKGIWELLNKADVVISHNGERFDLPKLNSRFIINGLMPPLPYQSIDTLKHIRRQFGFTSNKLDYVNQLLNLPRKVENEGMPLWIKCLHGDKEALNTMLEYNIGDVRILEETYLRIRPYVKPHPNVGLHILDENQHCCPTCGSANLKAEGKGYHTNANVYEMFRCNNCGSTGRKRIANVTTEQRRNLLLSLPR